MRRTNWWGCATGANTGTCDTTTGPVDSVPFATSPPLCVSCTQNADCNNGDSCSVADTCVAGVCHPGGGGDTDLDGTCNLDDNCPATSNPSQVDTDGDGIGDACDACPLDANNDADGDGVCGNVDNCPNAANPGQENLDGDSLGNVCDPVEGPLNVTRVQMKKATKTPANGVAKTKGQFLPASATSSTPRAASLVISDSNVGSAATRSPRPVLDHDQDQLPVGRQAVQGQFQTHGGAGPLAIQRHLQKQALTGPFLGPTQVHLTRPGDRPDRAGDDCVLNFEDHLPGF